MQELANSIRTAGENAEALTNVNYGEILDSAAADWAKHSLATFDGKLLRKALLVSAALAEFTAELEWEHPGV